MRVSTQFPIAVHALLMIAYFPNIRVTSDMVAESVGKNPVMIRNVYKKLKDAGLLTVQRGVGTTELTRPAHEITLWDVFIAVETDQVDEMFKFPEALSGACPVGGSIQELLSIHLQQAIDELKNALSQTTIEELRFEIEAHNEKTIDFPTIVEWYKKNGFDSDFEDLEKDEI